VTAAVASTQGHEGPRVSGLEAVAVAAVGAGLLLLRPSLLSSGRSSVVLSAVTLLAVGGVALAAPLPDGSLRLGGQPSVSPVIVLAVGLAALVGARAAAGVPLPTRVGVTGIAFNTMAAVAEEAFFRRFLYSWLLRWGPAFAISGSALAFAAIHAPAYGVAALWVDLGAGLLFSWQRWASGGWTVPAGTHAAANLLAALP
jgi:membrane protease YdiL (CAAX protease family)